VPENHAASTFGRAAVTKKLTTPSTKNATAPSTQLVIPCATVFHAQPVGALMTFVTTSTGFGMSMTVSTLTATASTA